MERTGRLVEVHSSVRLVGLVRAPDRAVLKAWAVLDVRNQVRMEVMGLKVDTAVEKLRVAKGELVMIAHN